MEVTKEEEIEEVEEVEDRATEEVLEETLEVEAEEILITHKELKTILKEKLLTFN